SIRCSNSGATWRTHTSRLWRTGSERPEQPARRLPRMGGWPDGEAAAFRYAAPQDHPAAASPDAPRDPGRLVPHRPALRRADPQAGRQPQPTPRVAPRLRRPLPGGPFGAAVEAARLPPRPRRLRRVRAEVCRGDGQRVEGLLALQLAGR